MVELHSVPPNGNEIKCANCGGNIIEHIEITFISCLSALSGEIEVYRDHNAESTQCNLICKRCKHSEKHHAFNNQSCSMQFCTCEGFD